MGVTEVPNDYMKGYDYTNSSWVNVAANASGEVAIARGETINSYQTMVVTNNSGGQVLGSGAIDRLLIQIPTVGISGENRFNIFRDSGMPGAGGMFIGGKSGNAPWSDQAVASGRGLFLGQETNVLSMSKIYLKYTHVLLHLVTL